MSSRRRVHDALGQFSHELRSFTTQLNEGVTVLKRVTDNKPTGGGAICYGFVNQVFVGTQLLISN